MGYLIWPITVFCLSIAVVIWTAVTVLRHGFTLKGNDPVTGIRYTKASRVLMWWLFCCSALFITTALTNSFQLFGVTLLAFLVGGIAAGSYIGKTSAYSHEEMQSCLSLRITSVAALVFGLWAVATPTFLILVEAEGTDRQYDAMMVLPPVGLWLMFESWRIWKRANEKAAENRMKMASHAPQYHLASTFDTERGWWISRVVNGWKTQRDTSSGPSRPRPMRGRPHLIRVPRNRFRR